MAKSFVNSFMGFIETRNLMKRVSRIFATQNLKKNKKSYTCIFELEKILQTFREDKFYRGPEFNDEFLLERVFLFHTLGVVSVRQNELDEIFIDYLGNWLQYYGKLVAEKRKFTLDQIGEIYRQRLHEFDSYECFFDFDDYDTYMNKIERLALYWNVKPLLKLSDEDVDFEIFRASKNYFTWQDYRIKFDLLVKNVFQPTKAWLEQIFNELNKIDD
jgi:hypothetical protein